MANDGGVVVPPDSTGKKVDCASLSVGGVTVYRQRVVLADNTHSANVAVISSGSLQVLVENTVTVTGQVSVTGSVAISSFPNGATVNISTMPAVVLAAGTANIGSINNISAAVALAAGTQHIGEVNISLMPSIVLAAGSANIGTIQAISAQVAVSGSVTVINNINISAMPNVTLAAANNTVGAVTVAGFIDPSGNQRNVVDSVNTALRVNVVAGGAGGGAVFGQVANGASVTSGNSPVLMGGYDGTNARWIRTDTNGNLVINNISATVNVAGSFTVGGQTGNASATAGSTYTLIGGMDGSIGRVALTDASGHFVVTGTVALAGGTANIGSINNISATVNVAGSLTIGGTTGATSYTAGSSFTMIGGMDGSLARGLLMDAAGHAIISGTVALAAGAANIGTINNISAGVVLAAGAANIGTINNISAAVAVTGHVTVDNISLTASVVLAAGTANIGTLNNISAGVVLAAGAANIGSINNISANVNVVLQTGTNNIGTVQAISAPVTLAAGSNNIGSINNISAAVVLAAGSANIGSINNISATVRCGGRVKTSASSTAADSTTNPLWVDKNGRIVAMLNNPSLPPSASHGPKTVTISTSAVIALVAAPGAGNQVYVTQILATNGSSTLTSLQLMEASATASPVVDQYLAASGGGINPIFSPPWRISANTALNMRIKPSVSKVKVTVHFYVGVD